MFSADPGGIGREYHAALRIAAEREALDGDVPGLARRTRKRDDPVLRLRRLGFPIIFPAHVFRLPKGLPLFFVRLMMLGRLGPASGILSAAQNGKDYDSGRRELNSAESELESAASTAAAIRAI